MRILQLNNWHHVRGGSDAIYLDTGRMLQDAGHHVTWFSVKDLKNIECSDADWFVDALPIRPGEGLRNSLRAAGRMIHSFEVPRRLKGLVAERGIQVAHGHCIYHRIGTSFIPALKRMGVPTVLSLHDYKIACPIYRMLRDGKVCEDCLVNSLSVVRHRCVRGSTSQSALYWIEATLNRLLGRYRESVAAYAASSHFIADLHVRAGIPESKIHYLPNCVSLPYIDEKAPRGEHFLFAGRLSEEKGISVLLEALRGTKLRLRVAGDGPLRSEVEKAAASGDQIEYVGSLQQKELQAEYAQCLAMVVPSVWYENASIAVLESFASQTPVIASEIGGLPEQVRPAHTGWLFPPGDAPSLRAVMLEAAGDRSTCAELGREARAFVAEFHSPERQLPMLLDIYGAALRSCEQ